MTSPPVFSFGSAHRVVFGVGALRRSGELLAQAGVRRAVCVTDPNLAFAAEILRDRAREHGIVVSVFDGGRPEPTVDEVDRAMAWSRGARPFDAVIGLGGGSNIDVAKAVAVLTSHGGRLRDHAGQRRLAGPVLPVIAVPTTAGSGSEVSAAAIVGVPEERSKLAIVDDHIRPAVALVDPDLHRGCPRTVTRDAGVDALCHAIEALTIADWDRVASASESQWPIYQGRHPLTDPLAWDAIERIATALPRALDDPGDLDSRTSMAIAALHAGVAMGNTGIHAVHALAYPVGAFTNASHGACNGALLAAVMGFVESARPQVCARIAACLGAQGCSIEVAVRRWLRRIEAPSTLTELGLSSDRLDETATIGHGIRRLMRGSPVDMSLDDVRGIVHRAFGGESR